MTTAKGILKVVSVLFIIKGSILSLISLMTIFASGLLKTMIGEVSAPVAAVAGGVLIGGGVIFLIASVIELVIGVLGLKKSDDPSQSGYFIVAGAIIAAFALISLIIAPHILCMIGFSLPILYIVGGYMLKEGQYSSA